MTTIYETIKAEIDADPLTRGYSGMTDDQVADDMNLLIYDAPASPGALLDYLLSTEFRNGNLYGRINMIASLQPSSVGEFPTLPLGASEAQVAITGRQVAAAKAMTRLVSPEGDIASPLTDTEIDNLVIELGLTGAEAMGAANRSAILALSQNKQSRARVLGLPVVREGDVQIARGIV